MTTRHRRQVPGGSGLPIAGHTPAFIRDAGKLVRDRAERYGPTFRVNVLGREAIVITEPDDVKAMLLDRNDTFSSHGGWDPTIGELFHRGLMLRDFDEHAFHRKVMTAAFRKDALASYVDAMNPIIDQHIRTWSEQTEFLLYPSMKKMILDIASALFIGERPGPETDRVNHAFLDAVTAAISPIRRPLPGTAYRRGMRGRAYLERYFRARVGGRRGTDGSDTFTRLANAVDEDGDALSDQEIVDHMIFLMLAAHDTTTGTLTAMGWELAQRPDWQERLRAEAADIGTFMSHGDESLLTDQDLFFRETMRWYPAVPFIPRVTTRPVDVAGFALDRDRWVVAASLVTHFRTDLWERPFEFEPDRFGPDRAEHRRHTHQYYPFGSGAHTCLGMTLASLQVKAVMTRLLAEYQLTPASPDQDEFFAPVPIPRPASGLPLILRSMH
jgi:cytochrome P450